MELSELCKEYLECDAFIKAGEGRTIKLNAVIVLKSTVLTLEDLRFIEKYNAAVTKLKLLYEAIKKKSNDMNIVASFDLTYEDGKRMIINPYSGVDLIKIP